MKRIAVTSVLRAPVITTLVLVLSAAVHSQNAAYSQGLDEGIRLFRQGAYEDAVTVLGQVAREDPGDEEAAGYLGLALVETGRFEEAEPRIRSALGGPVGDDHLQVALARIRLEMQDTAAALENLAAARQVDPDNLKVDYYEGIARLAQRDFLQAARLFERSIDLNPVWAMPHYYAGLAYNYLDDQSKMVDHFQMFLALDPNAPYADRVRSLLRNVS